MSTNSITKKLAEIMSPEDLKSFESAIEDVIKEQTNLKADELEKKYRLIAEEFCTKTKVELTEQMNKEYAEKLEENTNMLEDKIVSSLDAFLDKEITENISDEALDRVAINEVALPIVENIKKVLEESAITLDTDGAKLIKDKDTEISTLKADNDKHIAESIEYKELAEKAATKLLIQDKTDGLKDEQTERVVTMFEGKSFEDVESKIDSFIDMIVEEENHAEKKPETTEKTDEKKEITESTDVDKGDKVITEQDGIEDTKKGIKENADPLMTEVNRLLNM
jgi:hypothetical protein